MHVQSVLQFLLDFFCSLRLKTEKRKGMHEFNPIALRTAKTLWSFGHSECNRVKRMK